MLDGVFAFIIIDLRDEVSPKSYVARDTYGVRPLFTVTSEMCHTFGFSSEIKMMYDLNKYSQLKFTQFPPGHYLECEYSNSKWESRFVYNCFSSANAFTNPLIGEHNVLETIRNSLIYAVQKRVDNTDREIACLLSGGLDSSLITAIVANSMDNPKNLTTWSIGMEGSEDLKYAKMVLIIWVLITMKFYFMKAISLKQYQKLSELLKVMILLLLELVLVTGWFQNSLKKKAMLR